MKYPDPVSPEKFATFGDLLKYLRRREHLTQLELSIKVGYSEAQISRLEKNQRLPDPTGVKALFLPALHLEDDPGFATRLVELAQSARQADAPMPGLPPYKGLLYFDQPDAELFFGREGLTEMLVKHVMELAQAGSSRFLAVVGASGSGKSSLVRAGLAVALGKVGWQVLVFTPNVHPLQMLESQLSSIHPADAGRVLVLVDQFEEVFTLCRDELERIGFIEKLFSYAQEPSRQYMVVIALRADFYTHCSQYPLLRQAVAAEQEYIGQMTLDELKQAIEEPARRNGWELEPGLVDVMLQDLSTHGAHEPEPGALPLLSHALLATWENRRGRVLTLSGYHASGGVRSAIAETAESVFTDQLNKSQQEIAREVFLRLTELGEGTEDTRRRAALAELGRQFEETAQFRVVLNTLAEARLITLNEDSAEVAHEALIRRWQRLHEWLTQDREGLLLHRHLTEASQEWERRGRDASELYRGARLAQASEWTAVHPGHLNRSESEFLAASIESEQHETLEREAQRQRELEIERQRVEEHKQAANHLRRRAWQLGAVLGIALLLAASAIFFWQRANNNSQLATSRELAAASINNLPVDSDRSLLLAMQAVKTADIPEAETALHQAIQSMRLLYTLTGHNGLVYGVAYAPHVPSQPDRFATASDDGTIKLWEMGDNGLPASEEPVLILANPTKQGPSEYTNGYTLSFNNDGSQLAAIADNNLRIWDTLSGTLVYTLAGHTDNIESFDYSSDGKLIATASFDKTVRVWDAHSGSDVRTLDGFSDMVNTVTFSPDGKLLAAGDYKGLILAWNVSDIQASPTDKSKIEPLFSTQFMNIVGNLAFSLDSKQLIAAYYDIKVYDISSASPTTPPQVVLQLSGHENWTQGIIYSPDGTQLITGAWDSLVKVWNTTTGKLQYTISGCAGGVISMALNSDGNRLITACGNSVKVWDPTQTATQEWKTIVPAPYYSLGGMYGNGYILYDWNKLELVVMQFTPDSVQELSRIPFRQPFSFDVNMAVPRLAIVFLDNLTLHIFNPSSGAELTSFSIRKMLDDGTDLPNNLYLRLSPDGTRVAIAGYASTITVWDVRTGLPVQTFTPFPTGTRFGVDQINFNPDGTLIAGSSDDGVVRLWDANTGQLLRSFPGCSTCFNDVIFSPDGSKLFASGEGTSINLWDVKTGENLRKIEGYPTTISNLIISRDNKYMAAGRIDNVTQIWDAETGKEILTIPGTFVAFSSDDKYLLSNIFMDNIIRGYILDIHELMDLARTRLTRTWTQDECIKFLHTEACPPAP